MHIFDYMLTSFSRNPLCVSVSYHTLEYYCIYFISLHHTIVFHMYVCVVVYYTCIQIFYVVFCFNLFSHSYIIQCVYVYSCLLLYACIALCYVCVFPGCVAVYVQFYSVTPCTINKANCIFVTQNHH